MKTTGIRIAAQAALAFAALALAGCSTTKFQPSAVRARMQTLCEQHKYEEARQLEVKTYPAGHPKAVAGQRSPEEIAKADLIDSLVNPAEAAYTAARIRALEAQVDEALSRHDDKAARQAIYDYGITPTSQRTVDAVVYLAKNAFLNSRVNPATLARWEKFVAVNVDGSIRAGDYRKALAAAKHVGRAAAYPEEIDGLLATSADRAADQRAPKGDAKRFADSYTETLYMLIAPRAGFDHPNYLVPAGKWKDLVERLKKLQRLDVPTTGFEPGFAPDWRALKAVLADLRRALVEDDVSEKDADTIVDSLLKGYMALVPNERNGLTTFELNNRLRDLQDAAHARVLEAIAKERARLLAEAAAERARANAERLAKLQEIWGNMVKQLADAIDFPAREAAFTAAVSDRLEPAVNRMLGEGARVLRLHRTRGTVTSQQATSLLLAAFYMGFDDVANLALALGADIDGSSEKDVDKRTPYLLAIQYGFKGASAKALATADTARRDANNAGAVHYAVRANDAARLAALLADGADARTPDSDRATPLMLAARLRNPLMATMLLPYSDVDAVDAKDRAAVHFAAAAGDLRTLRLIVAAGANTAKTTSGGDDLVTLACAANAEDVLAYLLDELKLPVGERAVSWCVIHGKVLPLKTLVAHGGDLTDRHLAAAVKLAIPDMVRYLVEQGCDVNAPEVHNAAKWLSDQLNEEAPLGILAQRDCDTKLSAVRGIAEDFAKKMGGTSSGIAQALDAPWVALAGDDTASIATVDSPSAAVLLYLHSQGYRPVTPKGR